MPNRNHYSCFIINNKKKVGSNYYDIKKLNNSMIEFEYYLSYIKSDLIPYILTYIKII